MVRTATLSDAGALSAVAEEAFAAAQHALGRRPAPMDADFPHAIAHRRVLVADDASGSSALPLGYIVFDAKCPNDQGGFIDAVAVRPAAQGRGIGRHLIALAEAEMREADAAVVRLYTNAAMTGNLALYPSLGYRETGRARQSGFDRVFFEKALPPAKPLERSVPGLFGRRRVHGHRVGPDYARFAIDPGHPFPGVNALFGAPVNTLRLEVGFGAGEHLLHHARTAPDIGVIGVEPFETGLARAARDAARDGLTNVCLYGGDARAVLAWLPDASLDRVDILYPDPWPKRKHWKRRFISMETLNTIARVLKPGGSVRFASDIATYVAWTRAHVEAHPCFHLTADSAAPWSDWPGTRYEDKALRAGRAPRYLTLTVDTA